MTVFNANVVSDQHLDWTILCDGGVALYWQPEVLAGDVKWLQSNGYVISDFDAGDWSFPSRNEQWLCVSFPHGR